MTSRKLVVSALVLLAGAVQAAPPRKAAKAPRDAEPVATAVAAPAPLPPAAPGRPAAPAEGLGAQRPWVGLALGPAFPFSEGPVWLRGQVRVGVPLLRLDERLDLLAVVPLSVGYAREMGAFRAQSSVLALDLVPSGRLALRGPGRWGFHGDFGVGVAHFRYGFNVPELGEARGSATGLAFRAAAGVDYRVGSALHLFLEPLNLLFHTAQEAVFRFGNTSFTSSTGAGTQASVLAGAAYSW